jgi:hypothetical protein
MCFSIRKEEDERKRVIFETIKENSEMWFWVENKKLEKKEALTSKIEV